MGTILASAIISTARSILLDPDADWFSNADLLGALNRAERRVLLVRPELSSSRVTLELDAGIAQVLPANATALLDIFQNTVSKRRARQTSRAMLEHLNDRWSAATGQTEVIHWTADLRSKTRYDVYPPNDGSGQLEALIGTVPTPIPTTGDVINLNDIYETPLLYYVLCEAFSVNSEKQDMAKSTSYENRASQLLGVNAQTGATLAPKTNEPGGG